MFFRRNKPKVLTFAERIDSLRNAGFSLENQSDGRVKIGKNGIAALVGDKEIDRAGVMVAGEIGALLSVGYQVFFETPSGKRVPALAEQLKALHDFEDDVREALGVDNLYNTSLGTTNLKHSYDRVAGRNKGPRPWEKKKKRQPPQQQPVA